MNVLSVLVLTATPGGVGDVGGGAYTKIDGRESLLRAVEMFLNRDNIKQIQLVVSADSAEEAKRKFGANLAFTGVKMVVGGPRWIDQIIAGARQTDEEATHVLIHDAARPAVPYSDIDALIGASEKHEAVVLATSVRNALLEVDEGNNPVASHSPQRFMQVLTPQVYSRKVLAEMVASGSEPHASTLTIVPGSSLNVRLGAIETSVAKAMIALLPRAKAKPNSNPFEEAQW